MRPSRPSRRQLLHALAPGAAVLAGAPRWERLVALAGELAGHRGDPAEVAADEDFWGVIAREFGCDRSLVNLNNGGVSPSPRVVLEAQQRYIDYSNQCPAHTLWRVLEPQREGVRARLARAFGVDPEEVALTRNASESLETLQLGIDLERGDEVLTTTLDYPRMLTAFRQRERREGIVLRQISLPIPAEDDDVVVARFAEAITPRTRLILVCHMVSTTGQVLPVRAVVAMARARGIPVIVDGAHALAQLDFRIPDLECDNYSASLHKWLCAPHGTGFLWVRRERIADLWSLMASTEETARDIRKFEEIGTHAAAGYLAIADALSFHEAIGAARKAARLVHLRDRWARRLLANERVRLHTSLLPGKACAMATFEVDGLDSADLYGWLWREHRILTSPIRHDELQGVRVSPSVYTTLDEVDRFADAVERAIADGIGPA